MNKDDLETFLYRNESENLSDMELADFIELHLINDYERTEFKKRRISIAGCFTGKWEATDSNEQFLNECFLRWNTLMACMSSAFGLSRYAIFHFFIEGKS
jgi:hypothetical protein